MILLVSATAPLAAETAVFDATDPRGILSSSGVEIVTQPSGLHLLALADAEHDVSATTDLLLHFNTGGRSIVTGDYKISSSDFQIQTAEKALGNGAGLFPENSSGIVLEPGNLSVFRPGTHLGAFTIEFWLYPASPREGGVLFSWQGSSWLGRNPLFQSLNARVVNRKIVWDLQNFFVRAEAGQDSGFVGLPIQLSQRSDLIPRRWAHHMLRYNPQRKVLEYLVDGLTEEVVYITDSGRESGTPYTPYVGELSEPALTIGKNLNGILDELRISRAWVPDARRRGVGEFVGNVIFAPKDLVYPGARVEGLSVRQNVPGKTEILVYWMLSDLNFPPGPDDPRWVRGDDSQSLASERGRYLFVKAEFYPDGNPANRPGLRSVDVDFSVQPAPPAPANFRAVPGTLPGTIRLSWNEVVRGEPDGYLLYFGTSPGSYFGQAENIGDSPVDVGKVTSVTLTGLDPARVYYFRIGTYNYSNNPVRGTHLPMQLSAETSARPQR